MDVSKFFQPVPSKTADEVREYIDTHGRDEFTLLDVRQPEEYEQWHIPGALHIPLAELNSRLDHIDSSKPVIVYCRSGNRSAAATGVLLGAGFGEVYNMSGGMLAWKGFVAQYAPAGGHVVFPDGATFDEIVSLALGLEKCTGEFYTKIIDTLDDAVAADFFRKLVHAEEAHVRSLKETYRLISGKDYDADVENGDIMEGGVNLREALDWASAQTPADILEFSMALEINACDLYTTMARMAGVAASRRFFTALADEEWRHLKLMAELLDDYKRCDPKGENDAQSG